jgi:hypothetical protein
MIEQERAVEKRRGQPARLVALLLVAAALAAASVGLAPRAFEAGALLLSQDDPAGLADLALDKSFGPDIAHREIAAALAADDVDLANSFVELAGDRRIALDPSLVARVEAANSPTATAARAGVSFTRGLVTGEPGDVAGVAGMLAGDLFVFGDIRDAAREGVRFALGEQTDELVLGLATVGLAVTAGTYATLGTGASARLGVSLVKAARKAGTLGTPITAWLARSVRGMGDASALRRAVAHVASAEPALALRAARGTVKQEKADGLVRFAGDVGRVQARAGSRAALDGLKLAEGPRDVSRLARLAETKGGKTRAILKLAGRAAIALTVAAIDLAGWLFSALFAVLGFCSALKGATERATQWVPDRRWARRASRTAVSAACSIR